MNASIFKPHHLLEPFVECFIHSQMTSLEMDLIPRGNNQLFFLLNESHSATDTATGNTYSSRFFVSSPGTRHYRLICNEILSSVGVIFKPFGCYRLLGIPQNLLLDDFTDLEQVLGHQILELKHKMEDKADYPIEVLRILENWLLNQLIDLDKININAIEYSCNKIELFKGDISINNFSKEINMPKRTLEHNFQKIVGLSPKMFSRITRFKEAEKQLQNEISLNEIYFKLGYFDQSHFIKEFKQFSGYSPSNFFKRIPDLAG